MNLTIRQEETSDFHTVEQIIEAAFAHEAFSDQTEHKLVARLRTSEAFIPELSLVAEHNGMIVGHILFTKITIKGSGNTHESLALAPVSVLPEFQGKGIGGKLIMRGHEIAQSLGFQSIVLLGHAEYYPRFGYKRASEFGIKLPFEVPDENAMVVALGKNALDGVEGTVAYAPEFGV